MKPFSIAIHGGAGTIIRGQMTPELETAYREALDQAVSLGHGILSRGGTALDAVEKTVVILEDSPLFNAGRGSVFTAEGTHEMDASIMEGQRLQAGAVSLVSGIKNPVSLARLVMEKSGHVFLAGEGAVEFALQNGFKRKKQAYFYDDFRHKQWLEIKDTDVFQLDNTLLKDEKFGTVGAVACDVFGNVAAATSTGGMTNKKWGRIGDSPIIGAGTYANNKTCAVSCTGSGEFFMRGVAAYDVSCLMEYKGMDLQQAVSEVVHERLLKLGGDGGLIAVDSKGNLALEFNTEGMYRGSFSSEGEKEIHIYEPQKGNLS